MDYQLLITYTLTAVILSLLLAFPIIDFLYKRKIVRRAEVDFSVLIESRKEKIGTPIMGGIFVVLAILFLNFAFNFNDITRVPLLIFLGIAVVGGLDDILNLFGKKRRHRSLDRIIKLIRVHKNKFEQIRLALLFPWYVFKRFVHIFESNPGKGLFAHEKLLAQFVLSWSFAYWYINSGVFSDPTQLWLPILGVINLGWLMYPFVIIAIMGMINAVNFSDGMDGLSAGMLFNSFIGFLFIAIFLFNEETAMLLVSILGALMTYLYFNIPPARVQMGDIGSYSLGGLLAISGFLVGKPILIPIIGLPFVLEVLSTILQSVTRRVFGRRLLKMAPLHHHFEMLGWSEEKVVMRFWLFSGFCTLVGIWVYFL